MRHLQACHPPSVTTRSTPVTTIPADVVLARTLTAWVRLHGVGLEVAGSFAGMGLRPGTVLALEVDALADSVARPAAA